jgi:hypothetical protein
VFTKIAVGLACVAVAGGLFALGRATAPGDGADAEGFAAGHAAGLNEGRVEGLSRGRSEGVRAGRAAGVREGRALQEGASVSPSAARAFRDGYDAGANDVFGGFDGGWSLSSPYVITLRKGSGAIAYRIDSRRPVP